MQAGGGKIEDVFGGVEGESFDEEGRGGYKEDEEGARDVWWDGSNGYPVDTGSGADGAVVCYGFGEEDGTEEEEEGFDSAGC